MPLGTSLASDLEAAFSGAHASAQDAANAWGDAIAAWAAGIVPASTAVSAAVAALKASLGTAFAASYPTAAAAATAYAGHLATFAAAVGVGMAPAYTSPVPPTSGALSPALQSDFEGQEETHADAASAVADSIDPWMKAGTATLAVNPFTVVAWT